MKTAKALNKRHKILRAAATIFAQKGYSLTTLSDIAEEAGTFAGSLYYYFESKEKIVEEVLNIGTTSVSSLVIAKVSTLPPSTGYFEKVKIALEIHLEQMLKRDVFVVAYWKIIDQVPDEIRENHLSLPREYGKFWQRMLMDAQASGEIRADIDARLVRLLLVGSTIYALQWFKSDGPNTPTEIADVLAEMFFSGVCPRSTPISRRVASSPKIGSKLSPKVGSKVVRKRNVGAKTSPVSQ